MQQLPTTVAHAHAQAHQHGETILVANHNLVSARRARTPGAARRAARAVSESERGNEKENIQPHREDEDIFFWFF